MLESFILGVAQGVTEWVPISSDGVITLLKTNFFPEPGVGVAEILRYALFLHLGTFFAALVYFRKEVKEIFKTLFTYRTASLDDKKLLRFLLVSTLISGLLGFGLYVGIKGFEDRFSISSSVINIVVALSLMVTGLFLLRKKDAQYKNVSDLETKDAVLLGIAQGVSVLPGLSRSGLTISTLLLRKFDDQVALRLSFLMSLPIVLLGNIALNFDYFTLSLPNVIGIGASFIFGLLTIHGLLMLAKKINFGYFAFIFGLLVLVSIFI